MKITKKTYRGTEIYLIFNGPHYYLYCDTYGLLAYADRVTGDEPTPEGFERFNVYYGNEHASGGSWTGSVGASILESHIRTLENRHVPKKLIFNEIRKSGAEDLSNKFLKISVL